MGAIYKGTTSSRRSRSRIARLRISLNDMASGALDYAMFDNIFAASQERAGRLRILAVSTPTRLQANPNTPTMMEQR